MKKNLLFLGLVCLLLSCSKKKRAHTDTLPVAFNKPTTSFISLLSAEESQSQKHPALFPLAAVYSTASSALPSNRPANGIFSFLTSIVAHIGNPRSYQVQDAAVDDGATNIINLQQQQSTRNNTGWWRIVASVFMLAVAGVLGTIAMHKKQSGSSLNHTNRKHTDQPSNY